MAYDTWGGHWANHWALTWTRNTPLPPPTNVRIIVGISMTISGLTELYALTPDLAKGLVEDDYGNIPNRR